MIRWFILNLLIKLAISLNIEKLKPNEICLNSANKCSGFYDEDKKYKLSCIAPRCKGENSFQCMEYCALNIQVCGELLKITFGPDLKSQIFLKYETFFKNIKNCTEYNSYEWRPADICFKVNHKNHVIINLNLINKFP